MKVKAKVLALAAFLHVGIFAADSKADFNDGVNRDDPNYVTASLLVMGPGKELFACVGHTAIRLECPTHQLDWSYSYESESAKNRLLSFFAGNLKMGLFKIPTKDFLNEYRAHGRGVWQYKLNLTYQAKKQLWEYLDGLAARGPNQAYDYVNHGCAWAVSQSLIEAFKPYSIEPMECGLDFSKFKREFLVEAMADYPWARFIVQSIMGADIDVEESKIRKVVVPGDLVTFLKKAKVCGVPVISEEKVELAPRTMKNQVPLVTPTVVASVILFLSLVNLFRPIPGVRILFLGLQALLGAFFTYMICCSNLPATSWHWLFIPFNLLPLVFWHWRRYWALPFAVVLCVWEIGMLCVPHVLVDPAYLVLVPAFILLFLCSSSFTLHRKILKEVEDE